MDLKKLTTILNNVLERSRDAQKGYQEAAEKVTSPDLKRFFKTYSDQRRHFAEDIKGVLIANHHDIYEGTSIEGDLHRLWIDFKALLGGDHNEEQILEECMRGETTALKDYEEVLANPDLTPEIQNTLNSHKLGIQEAIISLKELTKTFAND